MLRALRTFLLLAAAVVFAASGIGWSYASASTLPGKGDMSHHRVASEAQGGHRHDAQHGSAGHHHESEPAAPCTDAAACGEGHAHAGDAGSCCAAACHVAMPAAYHLPSIVRLIRGGQFLPADTDGIQAAMTRLDRPPKGPGPLIG